jgi:hypothetical protein
MLLWTSVLLQDRDVVALFDNGTKSFLSADNIGEDGSGML